MKLKKDTFCIFSDILCLLLLFSSILYLIFSWNLIPDKIPGHYDVVGNVDRWGNKTELIVLPIINWILYLGITAVEFFPAIWNTGVSITDDNRERIYKIIGHFISSTKLQMVIVFTYLIIKTMQAQSLPTWFMPLFFTMLFGTIIYYMVRLFRAR